MYDPFTLLSANNLLLVISTQSTSCQGKWKSETKNVFQIESLKINQCKK